MQAINLSTVKIPAIAMPMIKAKSDSYDQASFGDTQVIRVDDLYHSKDEKSDHI
jgi:hypothetical protein